jgi:hypothetical protein
VVPPRRNGEPEAGWDREGVTTVVPAGEQLALGYACPAEAESPPVTVEWVGDADGTERGATASGAMRRLGDARPPRAVVGGDSAPPRERALERAQPAADPTPDETPDHERSLQQPAENCERVLRPYRERVETVEALGAAGVPTAAAILETNGGLAGIEVVGRALDEDAAALRALAAEATALAARAEAATPPTETLRGLS